MLPADVGMAQVIPDATLVTPSIINLVGDRIDINGGVLRGSNLFHRFEHFSIQGSLKSVYFNDQGASNIFSRVTGSTSQIDGTLGVSGNANANLFFINPKGIIFGSNARLDLGGSFVATTASTVLFDKGGVFGAGNSDASSILNIDAGVQAPIGLQFEGSPSSINIQRSSLSVSSSKVLSFISSEMSIDNSKLSSFGGKIFLSTVIDNGRVGIPISTSHVLPLHNSEQNINNNININMSILDVSNDLSGEIKISGNIIKIQNNSRLISQTIDQAGHSISINAQNLSINQDSDVISDTRGSGQGGDLLITTKNLLLQNGGQVRATSCGFIGLTCGNGNAGNVLIKATNTIEIEGKSNRDTSAISSSTWGVGKSGNISIEAGQLKAHQGGGILSTTAGSGNAGNINLNIIDSITLDGAPSRRNASGLFSGSPGDANPNTNDGNGGDIQIKARSLVVKNGAQIASDNLRIYSPSTDPQSYATQELIGNGKAGNIKINVSDVIHVDGVSTTAFGDDGLFLPSAIVSFTENSKDAGNLNISTSRLIVENGASVSATAGNLTSQVGIGNAGIIKIDASDYVEVSGTSVDGKGSRIRNATFDLGNGNDLMITTGRLSVKDGSRIDSRTQPRDYSKGSGNAGNIIINAKIVEITDGGQLVAVTRGNPKVSSGKAGNIIINANDKLLLNGIDSNFEVNKGKVEKILRDNFSNEDTVQAILSQRLNEGPSSGLITRTSGNTLNAGGAIEIRTPFMEVSNDAVLNAQTLSRGKGGDIQIYSKDIAIKSGGQIRSDSDSMASGDAGQITIASDIFGNKTASVSITGSSLISQRSSGLFTKTASAGAGGNIDIKAENFVISERAVLNSQTEKDGQGGQIKIAATNLIASAGGQIVTKTSGSKEAGDIVVNVGKNLTLTGSALPLSQNQDNVKDLTTQQVDSGLFANTDIASVGKGGEIFINSNPASNLSLLPVYRLEITDKAKISVNSQGSGKGGSIYASVRTLNLDQGQITAGTQSTDGGDITLRIQQLLLMRHQSKISTNAGEALGGGTGGNININASNGFIIAVPKENNDITANAYSGDGGRVEIKPRPLGIIGIKERKLGSDLTSDITASSQLGRQGIVSIDLPIADPGDGLNQIPQEPRSTEVNDSCQVSSGKESVQFFDIGRGGLAPRPEDPLSIDLLEWSPSPSQVSLSNQNFSIDKANQLPIDRPRFSSQAIPSPKLAPPCQS